MSVGEQALMEGKGRSLKELSETNPHLARRLVEKAGKWINTYWSRLSSQDLIQVYRNIKSVARKEERRRLMEYLVPRIILEAHRLYDAGVKVRIKESVPYRPGEEWDEEATVDALFATGAIDLDHLRYDLIRSRRKGNPRRAFVILADKSSSLTDSIHHIAVGTGMIAYAAQWDEVSIVVFDREIQFLKHFHEVRDLGSVIEQMIDMDSGGATDLFKPIDAAVKELARMPLLTKKKVLLVSDCIPTLGKNPVPLVSQLESLNLFYFPHRPETAETGPEGLVREFRRLPNVHIFPIHGFNDLIHGIYEVFMQ
jgi:hypothetical protein